MNHSPADSVLKRLNLLSPGIGEVKGERVVNEITMTLKKNGWVESQRKGPEAYGMRGDGTATNVQYTHPDFPGHTILHAIRTHNDGEMYGFWDHLDDQGSHRSRGTDAKDLQGYLDKFLKKENKEEGGVTPLLKRLEDLQDYEYGPEGMKFMGFEVYGNNLYAAYQDDEGEWWGQGIEQHFQKKTPSKLNYVPSKLYKEKELPTQAGIQLDRMRDFYTESKNERIMKCQDCGAQHEYNSEDFGTDWVSIKPACKTCKSDKLDGVN
jgi:hypothetical protein